MKPLRRSRRSPLVHHHHQGLGALRSAPPGGGASLGWSERGVGATDLVLRYVAVRCCYVDVRVPGLGTRRRSSPRRSGAIEGRTTRGENTEGPTTGETTEPTTTGEQGGEQ